MGFHSLTVLLLLTVIIVNTDAFLDFLRRRSTRDYDAVYNIGPILNRNLQLGREKRDDYVTVLEDFTGSRRRCRRQGVLNITLSNSTVDTARSRVLIDLVFSRPRGYVFNIGDSRTNNGEGGDEGTQSNDAEAVGLGTDLKVYLSDSGFTARVIDVENLYSDRLTMIIADGSLVWLADDDKDFNFFTSSSLFALNDQFDSEGPENFDIYLGINRAIKEDTGNTGSGVCSIGIQFLPNISG